MIHEFQETLLTIDDVSLRFGTNLILKGVKGEINNIHRPGLTQGQVVGLLGPSGRGKTQLSRVLAGLQKPTTGRVLVGADQRPATQGQMGFVQQHYPLLEHRTVMANLLLAAKLRGGAPKQEGEPWQSDTARIMSLLLRFGLQDKTDMYPAQLSGGQRQRIAIVQQLLSSENFIIMDEPFSGLDPLTKDEACKLITEVAGLNELLTIVVITHDIGAAVSVADSLWMLGWDPGERQGAHVRFTYDLIERGLAWQPDIRLTTQFSDFVREVTAMFHEL